MQITTQNPQETKALGRRLGERCLAGTLILLHGSLGAGKTSFVQGMALGLDIQVLVKSPTFTILREYQGRLPLFHFDLYRLTDPEELWETGFEEYLSRGGVVAVEWPEQAMEYLPPDHLAAYLSYCGETCRTIRLEPRGESYVELAEELMRDAGSGY